MNEPQRVPEPLKDLIDAYMSELLDEARLGELEEYLRGDADARRYFVRYARLHTDLYLEVRARQASARALESIEQLTQAGPLSSSNSVATVGSRRWRMLRRCLTPRAFVPAACLLLAIGAGWWLVKGRSQEGSGRESATAWLVNAQNCRWSEEEPTGDMQAGKILKLDRGLVEIRFQCGARVVLEGPASLELLSGKSARLRHGKLTARVSGSAVGFEILSPQGKVIDLGTEFGISVSENGATDVYVFEGKVEAHPIDDSQAGAVSVTQNQAARIAKGKVTVQPGEGAEQFVRAIVPSPVIVPRTLHLTFDRAVKGTIGDANGLGTGLTHRLPGTGGNLPEHDRHVRLDTTESQLALTTTRSDIRNQVRLGQGEYLGMRLADLGFTGKEDFAVTAVIPNTPALEDYGQFGLYAGTRSDRNIRGGLIKWGWGRKDPGQNTQFLVNNDGGDDTDLYKVGLLSPGTTLRLTLKRIGGKYSLTVENLTDRTDRGASTLTIHHPEFLDGEADLYVGLFGANPYSDVQKTLVVKQFSVTVWTVSSAVRGVRAD